MATQSQTPKTPYRQIRALYDEETITVYQAYPSAIADPALHHQRLSASPAFSHTRMTWIKPSWAWMMYRSGYSHKDPGQERVLALRMKHEHFRLLLSQAVVCHGQTLSQEERGRGSGCSGIRSGRLLWTCCRIGVFRLGFRGRLGGFGRMSGLWGLRM